VLGRLRKRAGDQGGFSLVELLVVMLITGILAGITLPGFINQRAKGDDTNAKAIARAAAVAIEAYGSDNLGAYDGASKTILNSYDSSIPTTSLRTVTGVAGCGFLNICWVIETDPSATSTGTVFQLVKSKDGSISSNCDTNPATSSTWDHGSGGCPASGDWDD
jgi:prepilin-type N-terminal cleavage/methylation domain-containing protein